MQNFTFGRKGTNWFLFAFVLLIGTLPSFGQEDCPEAGDFPASQTFCFTQTVSELDTDGFPVYQTDDNANDTQAIPQDELLADGETYFVGGESGQCERIAIEVTVNSQQRPQNTITNSIVAGFEFTTCTPANYSAENLANIFVALDDYSIEVYDSEESTTPLTGPLVSGNSYFVAQVPDGSQDPGSNTCPSQRVSVGFNPNQIEAPEAETAQTFCEDSTVADLEAEGTYDNTQAIRWYRSQNGNSPLAPSTQLIDGQTYYAGQVVNERGSPLPPCETPAEDRVAVTVTLGEPLLSTVSAEVCVDEIMDNPDANDFRGFFLTLIGNPGPGTFDPTPEELVAQYENDPIGTFETTYTIDDECEAITASVVVADTEEANAGSYDDLTLGCASATLFDLTQLENNDDTFIEGGTFSGEGVENNQFNTSQSPGEYTITYTVDESTGCIAGEESTQFTITLTGEIQQFDPISVTLCEDEVNDNPSAGQIREFFLAQVAQRTNLRLNGTFEPTSSEIRQQYLAANGIGTFETTYTVQTQECGEASIVITTEVQELQPANAGDFDDQLVECNDEQLIDLTTLTNNNEDANLGGTFSGEGVENNQFNPSEVGPGTYTITYAVDDSAFCVEPGTSDSTTFDIIVEASSTSEVARTLCVSDATELIQNPLEAIALFNDLLEEQEGDIPSDGEFTPGLSTLIGDISTYLDNPAGEETFSTTYTYGDDDCQSAIEISLTIENDREAEAGEFEDITIFCNDEQTIDLTTLTNLNPEANTGGEFSGVGVENNQFDASGLAAGPYTITYTVDDSADCVIENTSDETSFVINVETEVEEFDPIVVTLCEDEVDDNPSAGEIREFLLAQIAQITDLALNGTFNPTPAEIRQQYIAADGIGTFETNYTVSTEDCGDATVAITTVVQQLQPAEAGEIDDINLDCFNTGIIVLDDSILDSSANTSGTFSAEEGVLNEDGNFDPSIGAGTYTITYTVDDSADCVLEGTSDSTSFDIIVSEDLEELNPVSITICEDEVAENPTEAQIRTFFTNLVSNNTSLEAGGSFNPTPAEILTQFEDQNGLGIFETEYTVDTGDCGILSVMLMVEITPAQQADAGDFSDLELCTTDDEVQLSLGQTGGVEGGFFTIDGEVIEGGIFNPTMMEEGEYEITYTINEETDCVEGEDSTSFIITVFEGPNAGNDLTLAYCETEIESLLANPEEAQNFLIDLLESQQDDVDLSGEFDSSIEELFAYYNAGEFTEPFVTTYTVSNENCEDSSEISITINEVEVADAGEFDNYTFCTTDEDVNLNNEVTGTQGGLFTVDGELIENGIFSPSDFEAGSYTITYTVNESVDCVEGEDSTTFEIALSQGFNVGDDRSVEVCINEIVEDPTVADIRNYFRNLLQGNFSSEGTFEPSIEEIRASFQENPINTFTTIYTLGDGECSDSAELSVNVVATEEANAGEIEDLSICSTEESIDLFSLLSDDANENGYFEGYEDGTFNPSMMEGGAYELTYIVDSTTACVEGEDTTTFTIEVLQGANAGEDMNVTVCSNDDLQDLFSLISADADMDGEFTLDGDVITDGIMDPSAFEAGTYEVIYTVTAGEDDECGGDDTVTITITLGEAPEAPTTGEAVAFCAIDGETAARLEADGTNLIWYSDAALTMMVSDEDLLVNGEYYVTQSSDEGCESEAAMIMVNIVDSPAPTISSDYELCEFDNPTISDLTAEINESGEVTWYNSAESMDPLSNNAMLSDGTTYYATLISDNGCESSERLAVTVTLEECALLFPEAITPNGDGRNDRLVIENIEREYPNYNITVFNRWGNTVYKGNASTPTWDGTSNQSGSLGDDVLPVGVYFYVVDFNDGSTEPRQGKVYLNR
ncbi:gliding motility-associated C-terminal domain-containing protein [Salegentibacter sp. Hel_I_6]|uniref:gliding motility-associated C-terminal domain-containing protein n=1 Tax=Salegentibacter sp. Hel_I_6 TaxID=1250278 RepID=UPI00055A8706|nr:T9SS C-terminal target domain-containing protein [Salegentibacter sp. Hel_I_6]